jgi:hypothetical protein
MKKEGLVEVVTRERHSLNEPPWLPPTNKLKNSKMRRYPRKNINWNPNFVVAMK